MKIKGLKNSLQDMKSYKAELINDDVLKEVKAFHSSFDVYSKSNLSSLKNLADYVGVDQIYVKDESSRFNLNSFKVLGASYAVGKALARELNEPISNLVI